MAGVTTIKSLKEVGPMVAEDFRHLLEKTFEDELEQQARIGRKPNAILVDKRRGKSIHNVLFEAQAFFGSKPQMIEALREIWAMLQKLTRVDTGRAWASYALYKNFHPVGDFDDIGRQVMDSSPADLFSVVGPGVAYGRKLYWRPAGRQNKIKKKRGFTMKTKGGQKVKVYQTYTEPMHRIVLRSIRRRPRYGALWFTDKWVPLLHGEGKERERWPAITVGMKGNKSATKWAA